MSTELIKVTINGDELQVAKGSRLIDVQTMGRMDQARNSEQAG